MIAAKDLRPELLVFTGDVADDVNLLESALRLAHEHRPHLGVYASLGNHEYLHDISRLRPIYERSPVPLLVDRAETIAVGEGKLFLAGSNDPIHLEHDSDFFARSVDACLDGGPSDAFRLLLSHRPEAFPRAAREGFHLTLSGPTHGGQLGWGRRSLLERIDPKRFQYMWGEYRRGGNRLYTSAGFGHWFPYRLGCPTEVPLIVLERA